MHKCKQHGRRLCFACVIQTALFPIEHVAWEKFLGPLLGVHL